MENPRLGHIDFINCLPLTYSLRKDPRGLQVKAAVPSVLNEDIVSGRLDISPVSSIVYARNSELFLLMPDVSITADGDVQSIILVSAKAIENLTDDNIILTAKSATSHCLLNIILRKAYGASPCYDIRAVNPGSPIPADATASLLIGDDALYINHNRQAGLYYYDLGAEWKKFTGMRMVYAVWAVRREFAKARPQALRRVYERVTHGFQHGYAEKTKAIEMILADQPFTFAQLDDYLDVIHWDFAQEHHKALLTFYRYAHELQLIDHVPEIALAEVSR